MSTRWERWTTARRTWGALALLTVYSVIAFQTGPFPALLEFGSPAVVFDTTTEYDPADTPAILQAFGEEGRSLYVRFLWLDLLNPLFFGGALSLVVAGCLGRGLGWRSKALYLAWIPVLAGIADLLENGLLLIQLGMYPDSAPTLADLTHATTTAKLALVTFVLYLAIASLATWGGATAWRRWGAQGPPPEGS